MHYQTLHHTRSARADYSQWSIEELWQLAAQLRVTGARGMNRRELIDFFAAPPKAAQRQRPRLDKELS
jgi:hypothetical protein